MTDIVDLVLARHRAARDNAYRALWRAVVLAPNIETCEALLRGQHVPRATLDPIWRKRFGL